MTTTGDFCGGLPNPEKENKNTNQEALMESAAEVRS